MTTESSHFHLILDVYTAKRSTGNKSPYPHFRPETCTPFLFHKIPVYMHLKRRGTDCNVPIFSRRRRMIHANPFVTTKLYGISKN